MFSFSSMIHSLRVAIWTQYLEIFKSIIVMIAVYMV